MSADIAAPNVDSTPNAARTVSRQPRTGLADLALEGWIAVLAGRTFRLVAAHVVVARTAADETRAVARRGEDRQREQAPK
jgi:hypothetical protein